MPGLLRRFFPLVFLGLVVLPPALVAQEFLDPLVAFKPAVRALDDRTLEVRFAIHPGYYLYRDRFRFAAEDARLGNAEIPAGKEKTDESFGRVEVFYDAVAIRLPVERTLRAPMHFDLSVTSQGCAEAGLCYLPQTQTLVAELPAEGGVPAPDAARMEAAENDDARFAAILGEAGFWGKLAFFFVAGLGLSLTPCVFPMLPILSGIIVGHAQREKSETLGKRRAFALSLSYVLGMAVIYAIAGVAGGLSGNLLSAALQNAWALSAFAAMLTLLAGSMFGFYTLQAPVRLQSALAARARRLRGGHLFAVFLMGAISALIVGPCVAAPLAGVLIYIGQSGDALLGGVILFVMALGMGTPLLIVGASAGTWLPRAGAWMEAVKEGFGFLLLFFAVWLVTPVAPPVAVMLAYAVLSLVAAMRLRALDPLPPEARGVSRLFKALGALLLIWGAALFVGALAGSRDPLQPLAILRTSSGAVAPPDDGALPFERVRTMAELETRLQMARMAGRPVLLDFYADWCVACKEMERLTFSEMKVKDLMRGFIRLQVDVTANSAEDKALLRRFSLYGPPGILFFDATGAEIPGLRIVGFQAAEPFAQNLRRALSAGAP
ncbi:MAG: protein-disulfide reductase DsbD [Zoogloeaceae bacterium]|jgi:thiol:disulfide interchange protein DsbD|nr:protein-disulfide reductase DsbD [Zoogloeaceae bacterium]